MDPDLIIDVGMHLGEDSEFYLNKGFRVVAIEAYSAHCDFASTKLAKFVATGQLVIVNKAIAERAGPIEFFINDKMSVWGTTNRAWVERNQRYAGSSRTVTVDAITCEQIFNLYGIPYYLKVDIEGSDMLCLDALRASVSKPKFVSIESPIEAFEDVLDVFCRLRSLGYGAYKIIPQHRVPTQKPPRPSREKNFVDHKFSEGSSGLFGNELPGPWLGVEAALRFQMCVFRHIALQAQARSRLRIIRRALRGLGLRGTLHRAGLDAGWYDIHAIHSAVPLG